MNLTIQQIAEAFSKHEFILTYPHLSDTIRWNLVGNEQLAGKEAVIQACQESAAYLDTVTTNWLKFVVLPGNDFVVIDSVADYVDAQQQLTRIAGSVSVWNLMLDRLSNSFLSLRHG